MASNRRVMRAEMWIATSIATADFLFSSPHMTTQYVQRLPIAVEFRAEHERTQPQV